MQEIIDQAKSEFLRAKDRLRQSLDTTPDDRLNWSPTPSARTPIHQVAHAAQSIESIHNFLDGKPFPPPTTAEADDFFREWERQFTTREAVVEILERNSAAYVAWLEALSPERLDEVVVLPFSMGKAPIRAVLSAPPQHTYWHAAQIDYMQTIYGDRDWHL